MNTSNAPTTGWTCYARPVGSGGRQCGHNNLTATQHCGVCGCTWTASENRRRDKEAAEAPRMASRRREAARIRQRRRQH